MTTVYPNAIGFGVETPAGRGGQIVIVDKLTDTGSAGVPGELRYALRSVQGPRFVLPIVGGVVRLNRPLFVSRGNVTVLGNAAPWPGLILRGTLRIRTSDVFLSGITVWCETDMGDAQLALDILGGSHRVVVDHCTLLYSSQSVCQMISGEWNQPEPAEDMQISDCTISNCIVARPGKRPDRDGHRGLIVQEWSKRVALLDNLFADCDWRGPCWHNDKLSIVVAGNFNFNPGTLGMHAYPTHNLGPCYATVVNNLIRSGPNTTTGGRILIEKATPDSRYYIDGNLAPEEPDLRGLTAENLLDEPPVLPDGSVLWPQNYVGRPAAEAYAYVTANAGARPWDRAPSAADVVLQVRSRQSRGYIDRFSDWPTYPEIYRNLDLPDDPQGLRADGYSNLEHWVWDTFGPPKAPGPDVADLRTRVAAAMAGVTELGKRVQESTEALRLHVAQVGHELTQVEAALEE